VYAAEKCWALPHQQLRQDLCMVGDDVYVVAPDKACI